MILTTFVKHFKICKAAWWLRRYRVYLQCRRPRFDPWVGKIPWRRKWQSTPVFVPGESHGQRSLAGCSPWGRKELDTTEHLTLSNTFPWSSLTVFLQASGVIVPILQATYLRLWPAGWAGSAGCQVLGQGQVQGSSPHRALDPRGDAGLLFCTGRWESQAEEGGQKNPDFAVCHVTLGGLPASALISSLGERQ